MIVWGLRSQINNTYCSSFRFENNWEIHWSFTLTITFVSNETDWRKWFSTCNFARYLDTSKTCLQAKALQDCFRLLPKGRQETQIQALCGSQNEENKKQREGEYSCSVLSPKLGLFSLGGVNEMWRKKLDILHSMKSLHMETKGGIWRFSSNMCASYFLLEYWGNP